MLPKIKAIEEPTDVSGGKFLPYSVMGACALLVLYAILNPSTKGDVEEVEEDADEPGENEEEVK